jgi:hypothetical protein
MSRTRLLGLVAFSLGIAALFIPAYSFVLQHRANVMLRNVSNLYRTPGKGPTIGEVEHFYSGRLRIVWGTPVKGAYELESVNNKFLAALHWAPFTQLRSEIWVSDGVVTEYVLDFSSANRLHSVVSHVYIQDGEGPLFTLHPWEESSQSDTNGAVFVSPESFRTHEQVILGFDLNCLTSHRGCPTVANLLPTVWEHRSDGKLRCRLQNKKGLIEGPQFLFDAL